MDKGEIGRLQGVLLETFRPLIDPGRPVALVDFPDSINSGDHAIWLGEKALLAALGAAPAYQCAVAGYDREAMAAALGGGTILMHGGGNFGDIYTLYHSFRLRVLRDFPNNPVVVFPQTVMFFSDAALAATVEAVAAHGQVTLAARDALSRHVLERAFGAVARVVMAPDPAVMLGPLARSGRPSFDVVWVSRTDVEGVYGAGLAEATGLGPLRSVTADLGAFADGWPATAAAEASGLRLLVSDWYRIAPPRGEFAAAYQAQSLDQRARFWVERALRLLSAGRVAVTDRLHGHILASLAGIPHVLLNNSYGKNVSYFETWSRPSALGRLAATPNHAWRLAEDLLARAAEAPKDALRTDVDRWADPSSLHDAWRYRSERAASHVAPGSTLLDIGCGKMMIEALLPEGCAYVPHDVVARDARTRVCDLNSGARPDYESATHITVLGVLEYLNDAEGFWAWLARSRARVILSYVPAVPAFPVAARRGMGWFNDFTRADILTMADRAGFTLAAEEPIPPDTLLFVFDPRPAPATQSSAAPERKAKAGRRKAGAAGRVKPRPFETLP